MNKRLYLGYKTIFSFFIITFSVLSFLPSSLPAPNKNQSKGIFLISASLKEQALPDALFYKGFYLKEEACEPLHSQVSVLVNFDKSIFEMQALQDVANLEEARQYIDRHLQLHKAEDIVIRELKIFYEGKERSLFWVGDKSFLSLGLAQQAVKGLKPHEIREDTSLLKSSAPQPEQIKAKKVRKKGGIRTSSELKEDVVELLKPSLKIEYMSYGDTSYRTTGMSEGNYGAVVGWWEHRFGVSLYTLFDNSLDLYFLVTPAFSSSADPWDSTVTYGIGLEYRPFKGWKTLEENKLLDWIPGLRTYAIFLNRTPLKEHYLTKTYDRRVGVDLYKEYNFLDNEQKPETWSKYFWGEVWSDCSYRTTGFSSDERFKSINWGINAKLGTYLPVKYNIMPYIFVDGAMNEQQNFWENRMQQGVGLRLTPFRKEKYKEFEWLYGLKFFVEYHDNLKYFKDDPEPGTPSYDVRIGIGYSYNRY